MAEHFNDDALGRTLDAIYKYGATELFAEIVNEVAQEFMPVQARQKFYLDTTSLKLCGEYDFEDDYPDDDNRPLLPKLGHSKDHRPDLKQLVLSLIVSGPANLPIWFEGIDGNSQDKTNFHNTLEKVKSFRKALKDSPELLVIADSALLCKKNKLQDAAYGWSTRVPERVKLVKQLVESDAADFAWQVQQNGYQCVWLGPEDRGMRQHWAMIYSEQAKKRETISLDKRITKTLQADEKEAKKLAGQQFTCEKDAERAVIAFEKKLKYYKLSYKIRTVTQFSGRGRPRKTETPNLFHYQLDITFEECLRKLKPYRNKLGRFMLATNELNNPTMDAATLLATYKEQQGVERGFRFIKDPRSTSTVYF